MQSSKAAFARAPEFTPLQQINCRYFALGACKYGDACRYAHPQTTKKVPEEEFAALKIKHDTISDSRHQVPCKFFAWGHCNRGLTCSFAHVAPPEYSQRENEDFEELEDGDNGARELGGAIVQFGDGATVSAVSLRTEFYSFRLSYLPEETTSESIASWLAEVGVTVEPSKTRVATMTGNEPYVYSSAEITTTEPISLGEMRIKAASIPGGKNIEVTAVPLRIVQGSNTHTIDCRRVQCSWYRPVCTAWLNFRSESLAKRVSRGFQSGKCKIEGREVTASVPTGTNTRFLQSYTVTLSNLPPHITKEKILSVIETNNLPRNIEISEPAYRVKDDTAIAQVQSLLTDIGELEGDPVVSKSGLKRFKIQVKYAHESDARTAVSKLHDAALPFYSRGRLTVQVVISAKFKVLNRVYQAVEPRIKAQRQEWIDSKVFLRVYPPSAAFTCLKLEGQDAKQVASVKQALDLILAGCVVEHNGQAVWREAWGKMKNISSMLKPVEQAFGVFISRDTLRRQLRVYGPPKSCMKAANRLAELALVENEFRFEIPLDSDRFRWACQGGHNELSLALEPKSVTLDVVSSPKQIIIHGNQDDYEKALSLIHGANKQLIKAVTPTGKDCSACWTKAECPVRTQCGHIYCSECFEALCSSKSTTDSDLSIRCVGAADTCKRILPLSELREHLSSTTLEDILGAAFSSYIARNPAEFRFCPTPDCGTVYRVAREGANAPPAHTCGKCLVSLCTACHVSHENQSCAEYKSQIPDPRVEMLKKNLGIKDCPKCKTSMEKIDGCDHMTCQGCGAHICWKCMESFKSATDCYDHLNSIHGGIMDVPDGL
ncbi:unnamed protein product [Clonostachys rosea]|uniref:RING-type E3 ubiquitin transferase n=1 Tax=Bionectria ochroleuca TaxID=29856 RepID=A0ABY6TUH4_BIOOC|nr:unnamed protein product [Clonostachys rosea]